MPTYEYRRPDGSTFEVFQAFSDEPLTNDPETGVAVVRVFHAPAVHFKGSGFYNTDYGTRKRQRESAGDGDGATSSSGEGSSTADGKGTTEGSSSENGSGASSSPSDAKGGDGGKSPAKTAPTTKATAATK